MQYMLVYAAVTLNIKVEILVKYPLNISTRVNTRVGILRDILEIEAER